MGARWGQNGGKNIKRYKKICYDMLKQVPEKPIKSRGFNTK